METKVRFTVEEGLERAYKTMVEHQFEKVYGAIQKQMISDRRKLETDYGLNDVVIGALVEDGFHVEEIAMAVFPYDACTVITW